MSPASRWRTGKWRGISRRRRLLSGRTAISGASMLRTAGTVEASRAQFQEPAHVPRAAAGCGPPPSTATDSLGVRTRWHAVRRAVYRDGASCFPSQQTRKYTPVWWAMYFSACPPARLRADTSIERSCRNTILPTERSLRARRTSSASFGYVCPTANPPTSWKADLRTAKFGPQQMGRPRRRFTLWKARNRECPIATSAPAPVRRIVPNEHTAAGSRNGSTRRSIQSREGRASASVETMMRRLAASNPVCRARPTPGCSSRITRAPRA